MVEYQIKDFNQLIENPEKVNEKELTYISNLPINILLQIFVFLCLPKYFITKKELDMNNH